MSDEKKWTPGPWHVEAGATFASVHDSAGDRLAEALFAASDTGAREEALADANLIAAAPEMYEALRVGVELLRGLANSEERAGKHNAAVNVRAVGEKLYAALAKADGKVAP